MGRVVANKAFMQSAAAMVEILFEFLQAQGVDRDRFIRSVPFAIEVSQTDRMEFSQFDKLLAEACQQSNDPAFYLHFGQQISVAALGTLGYALLCCSNLSQVLDLLIRYQRLVSPGGEIRSEVGEGYASISLHGGLWQSEARLIDVELLFSTSAAFLYQFFGRDKVKLKACISYEQPDYIDEYYKIFGNDVIFSSDNNTLMIGSELLQQPMQFANPAMLKRYQQQCDELLETAKMAHYTTRVQSLLLSQPGNFPSFEQAADSLCIGTRTLRRRLLDEGVTYKQLVQNVRLAIAEKYLSQSLLSIEEVSGMLGYTDVANFRRAFISWIGISPAKFRTKNRK